MNTSKGTLSVKGLKRFGSITKVLIKHGLGNLVERVFKRDGNYLAEKIEKSIELGRIIGASNVVEEFERLIFKELDMFIEAGSIEKFTNNFREMNEIHIPKVYWPYTTKSVLIMEHIEGIKMDQVDETISVKDVYDQAIALVLKYHVRVPRNLLLLGKPRIELWHTGFDRIDTKFEKGLNRLIIGMIISASIIAAALILNSAQKVIELELNFFGLQTISITSLLGLIGFHLNCEFCPLLFFHSL